MKTFKTSSALILNTPTVFSISNAYAGCCNSHNEKKADTECLSNSKKYIDVKEKEYLFEVEA